MMKPRRKVVRMAIRAERATVAKTLWRRVKRLGRPGSCPRGDSRRGRTCRAPTLREEGGADLAARAVPILAVFAIYAHGDVRHIGPPRPLVLEGRSRAGIIALAPMVAQSAPGFNRRRPRGPSTHGGPSN